MTSSRPASKQSPPEKVLVVAGEASSDLHCASLIKELKGLRPGLSFIGVGGEKMRAQGVVLLAHVKDLGVMGFSEVFSKAFRILAAYKAVKRLLHLGAITAAIFVDYPEFNLKLARHARKSDIPVLYYISPQVWAWRPARTKKIARLVDRMLVLFQFEKELYERAGVPVEFVGHPLLDSVEPHLSREEFLMRLGLRTDRPVISLLPGSRTSEVQRLMPVFLEACALAGSMDEGKRLQTIVALAGTIDHGSVAKMLARYPQIIAVQGETYDALSASDVAIVASGTATLEAAILGVPMIVAYKVSLATYLLGRLLINLDHVALPNIIARRRAVPELIQSNLRPHILAKELVGLLNDREALLKQKEALREITAFLGEPGASKRAARAVCRFLDAHTAT